MNRFYVKDGKLMKQFTTIPEVVAFLEKVVELKNGMNRSEWMQHIIDLGHGYDDANGETFTNSLSDVVEVGVFKNGKPVRCNIHEAAKYDKPEYGD